MTFSTGDPGGELPVWGRETITEQLINGSVRGVRLWPDAPPVEVFLNAAREARWCAYSLNTDAVRTSRDYINTCTSDLQLPDYTGSNWDALEESLSDLVTDPTRVCPSDSRGLLVVWNGWSTMATRTAPALNTALDIWHDAVQEAIEAGISAAVVLVWDESDIPHQELPAVAALPRIRLGYSAP
jgi:hypothetical protein